MSTEETTIKVLRSVKDGDIIWVSTPKGMDTEEMDAVRDVLMSQVDADVTFILATDGFLLDVRKTGLDELLYLRDQIDSAIDHLCETQSHSD